MNSVTRTIRLDMHPHCEYSRDSETPVAEQARAIRAAGLDVFENEPSFNREFLALKNVALVPHIGSSTEATRMAMAMLAAGEGHRCHSGEGLHAEVQKLHDE